MGQQGPSSIDALLDLAPSRTNTVPSQWRQLFDAEHADSAVYTGVFSSCTAGRDYALRTAPKITVRLTSPDHAQLHARRKAAWRVQLAQVQRALRTRGKLPTGLTLGRVGGPLSATERDQVLDTLQDVGRSIKALTVHGITDSALTTTFLQRAAATFQNLTTLKVNVCAPCTLPPRTRYPTSPASTSRSRPVAKTMNSSSMSFRTSPE